MNRKQKIGAGIAGGALAAATVIALALPATGITLTADETPAPTSTSAPTCDDGTGRGGHGSGGPGAGETALTGTDAEQATAAAKAEIPDGTILRVETDNDGDYEAHVRKADGTEVVVKMDSTFNVTGVEEFTGRGGRGGYGSGDRDGSRDDATATPSSSTSA